MAIKRVAQFLAIAGLRCYFELMDFLSALLGFDRYIFKILNSELTHPWLDAVMPVLTDFHKTTFFLYSFPVFLVLWLVWQKQKCVKTLLGLVVAIALADTTSYHLIKKNIQRERPEKVMAEVQLRTHSHSGFSFPSNHAANSVAGAVIIRYMYPQLRSIVYVLALLVAYSRIYVGVHFPLDVLCGALVGYLSGLVTLTIGHRAQKCYSKLPSYWTGVKS